MNLLPKNHKEFRQKEYWDDFFKKRGKKAFEWYGEYGELCGILHKYTKASDNILVVGCGNSTLSSDLYDVGYRNIRSIDISDVAIRQMSEQNRHRPELIFEKMDLLKMDYKDGAYSVVLDKGTLDALMTDETVEVVSKIDTMFSEISRTLRIGGRYVCVSLLQPHILTYVVSWFTGAGWPIRIIRCQEVDQSKPPEDRIFPVFVIICTKFKKMPNIKPVLELAMSSDGQLTRLETADGLIQSVRGCQQFCALRAGLEKEGGQGDQEEASLDLRAPGQDNPKYSLFLTDRDKNKTSNLKFAAFIVPQGREVEWMFSTREGRRQLAESASCQRLVVVHLQRDHSFNSLQEVQDQLSGYVMELAPANLPSNTQVPFLSMGQEAVGSRLERCRGQSGMSGEYVVEDVDVNGELYRRLVFLNRPHLTQSEVRLKVVKGKNKKQKKIIDNLNLASTYHSLMIGSLGLYFAKPMTVLVVGLGGGALPTYIHDTFPLSNTHVVELDPAIVRVAQDQFGFKPDDRLTVSTQDGIEYIKDLAQSGQMSKRFSVIMLDVDSKDLSSGMSCPPQPFVQNSFLRTLSLCLEDEGMLVLNLVCRDSVVRQELVKVLREIWSAVIGYKLEEEVNEILYCSNTNKLKSAKDTEWKDAMSQAFRLVNEHVKKARRNKEELLDVEDCMKRLAISRS